MSNENSNKTDFTGLAKALYGNEMPVSENKKTDSEKPQQHKIKNYELHPNQKRD